MFVFLDRSMLMIVEYCILMVDGGCGLVQCVLVAPRGQEHFDVTAFQTDSHTNRLVHSAVGRRAGHGQVACSCITL